MEYKKVPDTEMYTFDPIVTQTKPPPKVGDILYKFCRNSVMVTMSRCHDNMIKSIAAYNH